MNAYAPPVPVPVANTYTGRVAEMVPIAGADGSVMFGPYRLAAAAAQQLGLEFYRAGMLAAEQRDGRVAQAPLPLFEEPRDAR